MIKYKDWGKHNRTGNYLFLYVGISSIAKQSGHEFNPANHFMWKYFKNPPKLAENNNFDEIFHTPFGEYTKEAKDKVVEELSKNKDRIYNTNLGSNLQSEMWFLEDKDYIKSLLELKEEEILKIREKYRDFFTKKTVGIGIRRGDFVGHGVFYQIPEKWYKEALEAEFPDWKDMNIVIFSDDINWCKNYYKNENFLYAEANGTHSHANGFRDYHKDPFEQFILASQMDNFIGGSSTFSWWNMWYVKNFNNGKVVHCGKNLSKSGEKEFGMNRYYYPDDWILYKIKEGSV